MCAPVLNTLTFYLIGGRSLYGLIAKPPVLRSENLPGAVRSDGHGYSKAHRCKGCAWLIAFGRHSTKIPAQGFQRGSFLLNLVGCSKPHAT